MTASFKALKFGRTLAIAGLAGVILSTLASASASAQAWAARHGMTGAQYQAEFNKYTGQGYRLTDVSGYSVSGTAYYAAIWQKKAGPAWVARHGMSSGAYQSEFNKFTGQGYAPSLVDGYESGAASRLAAIWEKTSGAWVARHDLTSAGYQAEFNKWTGQGYRLVDVSGYTANGQVRYAAIWKKQGGGACVARHGLTSAQYQAEFNKWTAMGYRLTDVSGYSEGGSARYAAIWYK